MDAAKFLLASMIHNDIVGDYEHKDSNEDVMMYQMPLTGENFKRDNKLVYASYVEICWCEAGCLDMDPGPRQVCKHRSWSLDVVIWTL